MRVVHDPIALSDLEAMASHMFGGLVKAVEDVERDLMAVDGEMHADEEALLLDGGSRQEDLWGINLYPDQFGSSEFVEFDSVVNIRPSQGNRTRSVDEAAVRERILAIVGRLVQA
jgi:hypothetical protein